jgi:hypothetical protein
MFVTKSSQAPHSAGRASSLGGQVPFEQGG